MSVVFQIDLRIYICTVNLFREFIFYLQIICEILNSGTSVRVVYMDYRDSFIERTFNSGGIKVLTNIYKFTVYV